ncbi:hypothetical protein HDU92_002130, partial [Lobulomyces angularis]
MSFVEKGHQSKLTEQASSDNSPPYDSSVTINSGEDSTPQNSGKLSQGIVWKTLVFSIIGGQFLALANAGTVMFASLTFFNTNMEWYPSIFPVELVYHILLAIAVIVAFAGPRNIISYYRENRSLLPWYPLMAAFDTGANVVILLAFSMTSPLSATIISSSSTIFAMIISYFLLKRRYYLIHLGASVFVLAGLFLINYSKYLAQGGWGEQFLTGNVLALTAAICYASSNVINEKVAVAEGEKYPIATILAMSVFGSFFSLIVGNGTAFGQTDRDAFVNQPSAGKYYVFGFIACMLFLYTMAPLYLQKFGAIRFNFSMLTTDIYVFILLSIANPSEAKALDVFYYLGFIAVLI